MKACFLYPVLIFLLVACSGSGEALPEEKVSLETDEAGIDKYVAEKLDTAQNYQIITGMRFSKDEFTYAAQQFSQDDTVILCTESLLQNNGGSIDRNIFYKHNLPVYVEEYEMIISGEVGSFRQRRIYLNGAIVLKAYERSAPDEDQLANATYKEITMTMNEFDFQRPKDAATQQGDFEMKFGEFLIFDLNSYLVLENPGSGYSVALYILKGDALVEMLYADPEAYKGKTIYAYHDFMDIGGLEQMVYLGGELVEEVEEENLIGG